MLCLQVQRFSLFDEHGRPIELADPQSQVSADPADINVLPEYGHDVRVVSNLFDSTFRTCDDAHLCTPWAGLTSRCRQASG